MNNLRVSVEQFKERIQDFFCTPRKGLNKVQFTIVYSWSRKTL